MTTCPKDCTCGRHNRTISDEHRANIAKANKARKGESHSCPDGCTCSRHKAYYRGGSKKGRKFSEKARKNISEGALKRVYTDEDKQRLADHIKTQRQDPEWESNRIEALREAGTACAEGCQCTRHAEEVRQKIADAHRGVPLTEEHKEKIAISSQATWAAYTPEQLEARSEKLSASVKASWEREKLEGNIRQTGGKRQSNQELALIPYMEQLGYKHHALSIGRKHPDFVDEEGRRIFEYFGTWWHKGGMEEEMSTIAFYNQHGWKCQVLWEANLFQFLLDHKHLVTEEEHRAAWKVAKINYGYRPPSE